METTMRLYQALFLRRITRLATEEQMEAVNENTIKHLKVMAVMILLVPIAVFLKLAPILCESELLLRLAGKVDPTNLTAVIMVMGGAWFFITFGAVPKALEKVAMDITLWMFMGFILSLEWLIIFMIIESPLSAPPLLLIFWSVYAAAVQYDTMDIFKAGLDESQLKFSRLGRVVYLEQLGDRGKAVEAGKDDGGDQ